MNRKHEFGIPATAGVRMRRRALRKGMSLGASSEEVVKQAQPFVPLVKSLLETNSTTDAETLKARAANHRRMRDMFPRGSALYTLYDNKLNVIEGKLRGARKQQRDDREDRASKWEWAALGKTSVVTGIVVGGALIALLLNLSGAASRSHRRPA